jgi:hypothetical protein
LLISTKTLLPLLLDAINDETLKIKFFSFLNQHCEEEIKKEEKSGVCTIRGLITKPLLVSIVEIG